MKNIANVFLFHLLLVSICMPVEVDILLYPLPFLHSLATYNLLRVSVYITVEMGTLADSRILHNSWTSLIIPMPLFCLEFSAFEIGYIQSAIAVKT